MNHIKSIPLPARAFGVAGLLPFIAGSVLCWTSVGPSALIAYGAVILSFLGGIRWGVAMQSPDMMQRWDVVGLAMVPSLLAWPALLVPAATGLILLGTGLVFQFALDYQWHKVAITPPWFITLRVILTVGAVGSVVIGLFGL